jgi:hypothetical protein
MDHTLAPPGIAHHYQRLAELSTPPSPARPVRAGPLGRDQGTAVSDPGPAVSRHRTAAAAVYTSGPCDERRTR